MAGKNKKEIRSFEAQNVRFLRSSSLTRILRLLIKKISVLKGCAFKVDAQAWCFKVHTLSLKNSLANQLECL